MKNIIFINLMVLLIILSGCSPVIKENADTIQLWEQKKSQLNISYNENNYPNKALQGLKAVKNKRIYPVPLYAIYSPGIRAYDGIRIMAQGLYPELYKEK